jgi:O-antigen ligase
MIRHSERLLTGGVALLLLWAPLPFGGVTPWAAASLQVLAFCALALAAAAVDEPGALRPAAAPAAALAAMGLLGVFQALPLPEGVVRLLSPEHWRLHRQAAELAGEGAAPRLSLAPSATLGTALAWAAAAACLLAAAGAGRHRRLRRWLAGAVVVSGLFQVFFGARNWFARSRTLWGVEVLSNAERLRGTFVNPNHAALYLGLALPVAFAWGWWGVRRARIEPRIERRILLVAPPCLAWLTLFLGLAFSGSRGGLLAALAAVTLQGVLLPGVRRRRWAGLAGIAAAVLGLATVAAVGLREGLGRLFALGTDVGQGARLAEYAAVLDLWRRFPVTGTGLGAFREAFPLVQPAGLPGTYWHPHSDLLEVLATGGLAGAALVAAGVGLLVRRLAVVLRDGSRSEDQASALAALGSLTAAGAHAAVDFGLTMPANALTLAALLGAAATAKTRPSAQQDLAGQDPLADRGLHLQEVEPRAEGRRHGERRPSRRSRPQRKSPEKRAVEP